jgi:hypothetical protein
MLIQTPCRQCNKVTYMLKGILSYHESLSLNSPISAPLLVCTQCGSRYEPLYTCFAEPEPNRKYSIAYAKEPWRVAFWSTRELISGWA